MKEATRWLFTAYFSEIGFLVGFPLFLLDTPQYTSTKKVVAERLTVRQRVAKWWDAVKDRDTRQTLILKQGDHIYNAMVWFQVALWIAGSVLKLMWLDMLLYQESSISANRATADKQISHTAVSGTKLWYLVAAVAVHFVQYAVHRAHLIACAAGASERSKDAIIQPWAYWLGHLSIINFALDLPGLGIPDVKLSNRIIIIINLAAVSMFAFLIFAEEPFSEAWGCYPPWYSIEQFDFGLCPAWLSRSDPESPLAPVCTAVQGAECENETARWSATMNHAFTAARTMLFISGALYLFGIPLKIEYYTLKLREAQIMARQKTD